MELQWNTDDTITIEPPKRPKKLTGTRLASVLGLNKWSTPFQAWCDITKVYNEPFVDTVYTLAGKAIEPKQIAYMRSAYAMDDLIDPVQEFGPDPFKKTYGNFFDHPVFGGMWDAIERDEDGNVCTVLEFKTTKRAEDWEDDIPENYALQAALYAWLLECDDVVMVASFLDEGDYAHPEDFEPSADNTATFEFKVSERYPDFEDEVVRPALEWWRDHIETGVSPSFDERADADYLKTLRKTSLNPTSDIEAMLDELVKCQEKVNEAAATVEEESKRVKALKEQLKQYALENIGDKDAAEFGNARVTCKLTVSESEKPDEKAMKADGVWDKYAKKSETSRFTVTFAKE